MPSRRARAAGSAAALAGAAALVCCARTAGAQQPEPVRLAWARGPGADACAGERQIAEQITARLGRSPFAADAARAIDAYVIHDGGGWRAAIYVRDRAGKLLGARELTSEAADCAALESASVLAIALAIDPDAGTRPPPTAALPQAPAPPPAAAPSPIPPSLPPPPALLPAAPLPVRPAAAPPARLGASGAEVRAGPGLGLLPGPAVALSLAAHVALSEAVELTGEALWMPEARARDARFAFGLSAFALGACAGVVRRASADLAVCGSLWGGALHAVVSGLKPVEPGDHAWAGAAASPRLRVRLAPRLHLEVGAHLLLPIIRRPFVVTGWRDPVFQQTPVALLPFGALGTSFP